MKYTPRFYFSLTAFSLAAFALNAEENKLHTFERIQLSEKFHSEGATFGDINNNGTMDVVAGPFWYEGPDFEARHEIYEPQEVRPEDYSQNFLAFVHDFNGNGWTDVLVIGFPGAEAYWYENPQGEEGHWNRHLAFPEVDNESPTFGDLTGDGNPELIFHHEGYLGYARPDFENPTEPWTFQRLSTHGNRGRYQHGLGFGDVNGNGRMDFLESSGWWENTGEVEGEVTWTFHPVDFGGGGAQMYAYDVDGDGYNDVITSIEAHGWGLAWFRQVRDENGGISFERNIILNDLHEDSRYGVRFSQMHAIDLVDMDNSGVKDIVTGKRFWAHGPFGDPEPNAPAVLYWFKTVRDAETGEVEFIPHRIDDDSGVGTQVVAGDITGNEYPDVVVGNKKGTFVFRHSVENVSREEWEKAQPRIIKFHRRGHKN